MRSMYSAILQYVKDHGKRRSPRGLATLDIGPTTIVLHDTKFAVPTDIGRKLNLKIGAAETVQLLAGVSDATQLSRASNGRFMQFTNDGLLKGAYGPRTFGQIPGVLAKLSHDSDSRQGWLNIWRENELEDTSKDVPCTLMLGFAVEDGKLNMTTVMRSNDLWLGVPYDFMMFTRVQAAMAWALGVGIGKYTHTAMSLHVYERDVEKVNELHLPDGDTIIPYFTPKYDTKPGERSAALARTRWARMVAEAKACVIDSTSPERLGDNAWWYYDLLQPYRSGNLLCSVCRYVKSSADFYECHMPRQRQGICKSCATERKHASRVASRFESRLGKYGWTVEDYEEQLKKQNGVCAICEQVPDSGPYKDFVIDHDHNTGTVRGLLCNKCNNGLGLLGDDVTGLRRALSYLEETNGSAYLG